MRRLFSLLLALAVAGSAGAAVQSQHAAVLARRNVGVTTITFVAAAASNNGSAVNDITVSYPGGTAANDIALLFFASSSDHDTSGTPPTGWTKIFERDSTASDTSLSCFWKRLAGGETSDTWTDIFGAGENALAIMVVYRGCVASGSPIEDFDTQAAAAGTAKDLPSSTSLGLGRMFVGAIGSDPNADPAVLMTWDSPATERVDRDTTPSGGYGLNAAVYVADYIRPTAGATVLAGDLGGSEETSDAQVVLIPAP